MSARHLDLVRIDRRGRAPLRARIDALVIAGWTGRDAAALAAHIEELAALGVARPCATPIFYRVGADLLTTDREIEVVGTGSTGEVEAVILAQGGGLWVGVGSDHTDRDLERAGVTWSKQVCPKPLAAELWPFEEVAGHWDRLVIRSHATIDGGRRLYQEGTLARNRPPRELIGLHEGRERLTDGTLMFCGTQPAHGPMAFAERFEIEIEDPVLGRRIAHEYRPRALPVEG